MFRFLLAVLVVGLLSSYASVAYSEFQFRDGSKIEIQWYEEEGLILNDEVCFNYKNDYRKYRLCRKKAVDYFRDECDFYTSKVRNSPRKYRDMYVPEKDKFCSAHESYEP